MPRSTQDIPRSQKWRYPLRPIAQGWIDKIRLGERAREPFDNDARECLNYLKGKPNIFSTVRKGGGPTEGEIGDTPPPAHQISVNKAYEFKSIYGPVLYHRNPQFRVSSRKPPQAPPEMFGMPGDPSAAMMWQMASQQQQSRASVVKSRAEALQFYLNYLPNEVGLKDESRRAIDQALMTGAGYLFPELIQPLGSNIKLLTASWVDVFDVVADPDMRSMNGAYWWARRRVAPYWECERLFGLDRIQPGMLKDYAQYSSSKEQGRRGRRKKSETGRSNDLIEWYEVYSRMGFGDRLQGKHVDAEVRQLTDQFGDHCFIAVAEGVPFPLNLPAEAIAAEDEQALFDRVQWPVPFYLDDRPPFANLAFHEIPGELYPISPLKPGLPELKFISWCMSYLAGKVKTTCRDFIAMLKSTREEIKTKVLHGPDLTLLELERTDGPIDNVIKFLQHAPINADVWKVLQIQTLSFEKRVGLTELNYAMTDKQMRSATEANMKQNALNVRPDDMLNKVENWMTDLGRMWAMMARWYIDANDVMPVGGPVFAQVWQSLVMSADISDVTREIDLRVEAGSTKKPNYDKDIETIGQFSQVFLPMAQQQAAQFGDYTALNNFTADWAKARQLDPQRYQFNPQPALAMIEAQQQQAERDSKEEIADKKASTPKAA